MVIPLVVLGRGQWLVDRPVRRIVVPAVAVGGVFGVLLSLPQTAKPVLAARTVGSTLQVRFEGYERMNPDLFQALDLFSKVLPGGYVPEISYGGSPLAWNYYAQQAKGESAVNYIIQPLRAPPPGGMALKARDRNAAVYVADEEILRSHLALRPATPAGARLYALPRETMFPREGPPIEQVLLDVAKRIGLRLR